MRTPKSTLQRLRGLGEASGCKAGLSGKARLRTARPPQPNGEKKGGGAIVRDVKEGGKTRRSAKAAEDGKRPLHTGVSPIELLSMVGFSLCIGWMLVVCYWLFRSFPYYASAITRDFAQMWVFVGTGAGFIALHFMGLKPHFNPFSATAALAEAAGALALPLAALLQYGGVECPLVLICLLGLFAGASGSFITTCWLDVCCRLRTTMFGRFTGVSFLLGTLFFAMAAISPYQTAGLFGSAYAVASIALLLFASKLADANDERAHLESVVKGWTFAKEVEPSFFMFGITFGMTFAWLFKTNDTLVFAGLMAIAPGAFVIALLSVLRVHLEVTVMLRILLCVCVASCIFMPLANEQGRLVCSLVVIAAWAMFTTLNYSFMIKKSVVRRDVPLFRQAPARLAVPQLGFVLGWLAIYLGTMAFGAGSEQFAWIRSTVGIVLVVTFMLFFPIHEHHTMDGEPATTSDGSYLQLTEKEAWSLRIRTVVDRYQLTPREEEILRYLARGRNTAYIQEKLVVSPHTVKSHVYNIYKKLDVHSQQQLIDLVDFAALEEPNSNEG